MVLKLAVEVKAAGTRKNEPSAGWGAASHKRYESHDQCS
jgi:hypothetical protein